MWPKRSYVAHDCICIRGEGEGDVGMMPGWWWSGPWADEESPVADWLNSPSASANPENLDIPPSFCSQPSSPLTLHIVPGWSNLIPSLKPCPLLGWFPNLYCWPCLLCWAPEQCTQPFLDNPSGNTISTSPLMCINQIYHPPQKKPCYFSWWMALPTTQLPKLLIWESRIISPLSPSIPNNHQVLLRLLLRFLPVIKWLP